MTKQGRYYGNPLTAKVEDGRLLISIGVQTLAHAVTCAAWANPYDEQRRDYIRTFAITDPTTFAKDVVRAMLAELEDGSSALSDFLDDVAEAAVDDGSEACEYEQVIKHGTTAPVETWAPSNPEP